MLDQLFIHIGIQKTGTTKLQKEVFAKHPGILNIGKPYTSDKIFRIIQLIRHLDGVELREKEVLELSRKIFPEIRKRRLNRKIVLSEECLTTNAKCDRLIIAKRLRKVFGPAKIIMTIRSQFEVLESVYLQQIRHYISGGCGPFVNVEQYLRDAFEGVELKGRSRMLRPFVLLSPLPRFDYFEIAKVYSKIFGEKNMKIFLFEDMKDDYEKFLLNIFKFIDLDLRNEGNIFCDKIFYPRVSSREYNYAKVKGHLPVIKYVRSRRMPAVFRHWVDGYLRDGKRCCVRIGDKWLGRIREYYQESNNNLMDEYNLDLKRYGYPL